MKLLSELPQFMNMQHLRVSRCTHISLFGLKMWGNHGHTKLLFPFLMGLKSSPGSNWFGFTTSPLFGVVPSKPTLKYFLTIKCTYLACSLGRYLYMWTPVQTLPRRRYRTWLVSREAPSCPLRGPTLLTSITMKFCLTLNVLEMQLHISITAALWGLVSFTQCILAHYLPFCNSLFLLGTTHIFFPLEYCLVWVNFFYFHPLTCSVLLLIFLTSLVVFPIYY